MPTPAELTTTSFLALVRESKLIDADRLHAALAEAPAIERPKPLARFLVELGLLTVFQAQQLLIGRSGGFFLAQYRILDLLGRGGMGKVYKAEHMTMGRIVALKVLNSEMTRTDQARKLFRREVQAAARLVHPNIATAFDANEINDRAFLVLEYICGPSLSQLVKKEGPLPIGQACEFIRQAALGLQQADDLGMVHCDIKPSNLLIQSPTKDSDPSCGTLKIVDFGLAMLPAVPDGEDAVERERAEVLGTPDYLSPEQAVDIRQVDIRSDLYSLGCTFYYLLTGQPPFAGGTAIDKIRRHASQPVTPVEYHRPAIPPAIAAIVAKLLAKKPSERFQTPLALAHALSEFAEVKPVRWVDDRTITAIELDPAIEPDREPRTGSASGPSSISDIASTLDAFGRTMVDRPNKKGNSLDNLYFVAAIAAGFFIGAILIVAAVLFGK